MPTLKSFYRDAEVFSGEESISLTFLGQATTLVG